MKLPAFFRTLQQLLRSKIAQRLARNTGWLLATELLANVLSLFQYPMVLRSLGVPMYGRVNLAISTVGLIFNVVGFQMREVILTHLTEALAQKQVERAAALIKISYALTVLPSLVIMTGILLLARQLTAAFFDSGAWWGLVMIAALYKQANFASGVAVPVLRVCDRFRWLSIVQTIKNLVTYAGLLLVFAFGWGAVGYLVWLMVTTLLHNCVLYWYSQKTLWQQHRVGEFWKADLRVLQPQRAALRTMIGTLYVRGITKGLTADGDVVILGWFCSDSTVGLYKLAKQLAYYIQNLSEPLYVAIFPEIARTHVQRTASDFWRLVRHLAIFSALATGFGLGLVLVLGQWVIPAVFGIEYVPALPIFSILVFINIGLVLMWAPSVLYTTGKTLLLMGIELVSVLGLLLCGILLTARWQATGMAIAMVGQQLLVILMVLAYFAWQRPWQSVTNPKIDSA